MRTVACTKFRWAPIVLAALAFAALAVRAQTTGGSIQGQVVDQAGQPVIGAVIHVSGPSLQGSQGVATDVSGQYVIPFLPPGKNYTVEVEAAGYNKVIRGGITVPLGATVSLPFTLSGGSTVITVTASAPTADLKSTTTGVTLSDTLINAIPLQRDAGALAFLAPTAVNSGASTPGNASIAGSTGAENNYIINGVDVTDTGYGTNASALNFDFIQDMEVLTGGLPPEYGSAMGGVVNAITQEGGNEFHGSALRLLLVRQPQANSETYVHAPTITGNGLPALRPRRQHGRLLHQGQTLVLRGLRLQPLQGVQGHPDGGLRRPVLYLNGAPAQSIYAGQRITDNERDKPACTPSSSRGTSTPTTSWPTASSATTSENATRGLARLEASHLRALSRSSENPYNLAAPVERHLDAQVLLAR